MKGSVPDSLADVLEALGFAGQTGLVSLDDSPDIGPKDYVWRDLGDRVHLDAAFFQDGVPLVGFTSETGQGLDSLRRRLWNFGRVPLLVAADTEDVKILDGSGLDVTDPGRALLVVSADRRSATAQTLMTAFSRAEVEAGNYRRAFAARFQPGG